MSAADKVTALKYEVEEVGKHIKGSKKRHLWVVEVAGRAYNLLVEESLMSNKTKLSINGKVFHQAEPHSINKCLYSHGFVLQGHQFNISQIQEGAFELRIDNNLFSHMLQQRMNQQEFTKHHVSEEEFALKDTISAQHKEKITLSLPGMMKKKKPTTAQSDNWGGLSQGFPNYFGEEGGQPQPKQQEAKQPPKEEKREVKEEVPEVPSAEEFNTLQNMFKTIVGCGEYVPKEKEGETPTYDVEEIPALPAINLQEFNTMQNLFATVNPAQQAPPPPQQAPPQQAPPKSVMTSAFKGLEQIQREAPSVKAEDFNTMQQLFATMNKAQVQEQVAALKASNVNASDFNTMQQLFATMNPGNKVGFEPIRESQNESESSIASSQAVPDANDFNTLQAMFATNMGLQVTQGQAPQASRINMGGQKTMQQLFESNLGGQEALQASSRPNQEAEALKVSAVDFNTMQQLFATQAGFKENAPQ